MLDKTFFLLERGKKYLKASLVLILLLKRVDIWVEKRGYWFLRLVMNLKHLKMKNEALKVCDIALARQGPIAT